MTRPSAPPLIEEVWEQPGSQRTWTVRIWPPRIDEATPHRDYIVEWELENHFDQLQHHFQVSPMLAIRDVASFADRILFGKGARPRK